MLSAKEFFEKIVDGGAFRGDVLEAMETKRAAGAADPAAALSAAAADLGYEVSVEQAAAYLAPVALGLAKVSDDDLESVAGGYLYQGNDPYNEDYYEVIDDKTGEVLWSGNLNTLYEAWEVADKYGASHALIDWDYLEILRRYPRKS